MQIIFCKVKDDFSRCEMWCVRSLRVLCDSAKLLVSVDEIKNLQCCLAGRHVKCGNVSIKH